MNRFIIWAGLCLTPSVSLFGQAAGGAAQLPDGPGRETVIKICASCHPAAVVLGKGMSREQWGNLVSNMISRGAKGSDSDFAVIVDYLTKTLPPRAAGGGTSSMAAAAPARKPKGGGLLAQAGASDKHIVDEESAGRGKTIYIAQCITCHGPRGRGTEQGPDMVRSLVVLKDRYGSMVGPFLQKGHPMQSGAPSSSLTQAQIEDLSNFLHQKVDDTLRTGPYNTVLNVLTGDPKAGKAYFEGAGTCSSCHSVTGNLAGIGSKYNPAALQLKFVFPQTVAFGRRAPTGSKKPVTVDVTTASGEHVSGVLLEMDDFSVALKDAAGMYHSYQRTPGVTVEKHDPYAAHEALLDRYTDQNIHDVVAYLETVK